MSTRWRRLGQFALMVGCGVAVVYLLGGDAGAPQRPQVRRAEAGDATRGQVRIPGEDGDGLELRFDEATFDIIAPVEIEPGRFEDRKTHTIHISSGRPGPDSTFLATDPLVHLLDGLTGKIKGHLRAERAVFLLGESSGGDVSFDLSAMQTRRFRLMGNVRGTMPGSDGLPADFEAEEVHVDGPRVTAPGPVTWSRPDATITGLDMSWDEDSGRLEFVFDTEILLHSKDGDSSESWAFFAPAGLLATIPPQDEDAPDEVRASQWELRGGVTGVGVDGTRLAATTLFVDTLTSTIILEGSAVAEQPTPDDGLLRIEARRLLVSSDETGRVSLINAEGDVRLFNAPAALAPSWMAADHLLLEDGVVRAPAGVTWERDGVVVEGRDLTYDTATGQAAYAGTTTVTIESGDRAGTQLVAAGGLEWTLPPDALDPGQEATAHGRGGVHGKLPDGTVFEAAQLFFDGPRGSLELLGDAVVTLATSLATRSVQAGSITLSTDGNDQFALLVASSNVVLISQPPEGVPTRVATAELELVKRVARSPGEVTVTRGNTTFVGTGMRWIEDRGELDFEHDARASFRASAEDAASGSGGVGRIEAPGGLTWWTPLDPETDTSNGHGELRGPVRGLTADGLAFAADHMLMDEDTATATLVGSVVLDRGAPDPLHLESERLLLEGRAGERVIHSPGPVWFVRGSMTASGDSLVHDEGAGTLVLSGSPSLQIEDDAGGLRLDADKRLVWSAPPDATDPLAAGRVELTGRVRGTMGNGSFVRTNTLLVLNGGSSLELHGNAAYGQDGPDQGRRLEGTRLIRVRRDELGAVIWVTADGAARAELWGPASDGSGPMRVAMAGDSIVMDRLSHVTTVHGPGSVVRTTTTGKLSVEAGSRIVVTLDEADGIRMLDAEDRVVLVSEAYHANGDTLNWDVPLDEALLRGQCRLFAMGAWWQASEILVRPRAERFEVLGSEMQLDG